MHVLSENLEMSKKLPILNSIGSIEEMGERNDVKDLVTMLIFFGSPLIAVAIIVLIRMLI